MQTKYFSCILVAIVAIYLTAPAFAQTPTFKMTTETPANVLIPDEVDTRLGTLKFFDGVPTAETAA